jgi:hypothetical protein
MKPSHYSSESHYLSLGKMLACAVLSVAAISTASAAVTWKNIQFGGFLSQGYMDSTNNNYPVDTKDGTFDFREEALNASTTFGTHLRLAAQVFAQKLGKYGDDKPILDWAVADYNFCPQFGIQVGRLKYPQGLNSDVLDLDAIRPFILLPQSNYDSRLRDFQSSLDGAKIYGTFSAGQNSFDYKLFYGDIPMKARSGVGDYGNTTGLFANPPGIQSIGVDSVHGAALTWTTPINGLRFGLYYSSMSHLKFAGPFVAMPTLTTIIDTTSTYKGGSVEYTQGPWTFTGEYQHVGATGLITMPPAPRTIKSGFYSYYVTVARRLGSKFEVGTYYSDTKNDDAQPGTSTSSNHRADWAVAVRYDFSDHLLFKLEVHDINGTKGIFNVPGISNPTAVSKDSMMLFVAKTTLSF